MGSNTTETVIFTARVDAGGVTHYLVVRNGPEAGRQPCLRELRPNLIRC